MIDWNEKVRAHVRKNDKKRLRSEFFDGTNSSDKFVVNSKLTAIPLAFIGRITLRLCSTALRVIVILFFG